MKDPAFLFYSSDFANGVSDLTMEERGQYITLLCCQHQKGFISERWIQLNMPKISDFVLAKFEKNEDGNYINTRLLEEVKKRKKHSEKQRVNIKKRWDKDTKVDTKPIPNLYQTDTKAIPLENEDENVNEIEDIITDVIENLNANAGKGFNPSTDSHRKHIRARIKEGATLDDFILVIEYKSAEWISDTKSRAWLRPQTLFNSEKFQIYLDESRNKRSQGVSPVEVFSDEGKYGGKSWKDITLEVQVALAKRQSTN